MYNAYKWALIGLKATIYNPSLKMGIVYFCILS